MKRREDQSRAKAVVSAVTEDTRLPTLPCGHPAGCVQGKTTLYCGWCADRSSMARYFGQIERMRAVVEAARRVALPPAAFERARFPAGDPDRALRDALGELERAEREAP